MIELFSRKQDIFKGERSGTFVPIVIDEEISSLLAILLNDSYYNFLKQGKGVIDGISVLLPTHLISFKARAFVDLTMRKKEGKHVNPDDIKKHRNDVFRLIQLLTGEERLSADEAIKSDIRKFLAFDGYFDKI